MWFTNLAVYKYDAARPVFDMDALEKQMSEFRFIPCKSQDKRKFGWVPPIHGGQCLTHIGMGAIMLCALKEEKILPPAVINKEISKQTAAFELMEARPPKKRERDDIKESIILDMLPKAFTSEKFTRVLILRDQGLVIVDSSTYKNAEDVLALLRKTIGSLPVVPALPETPIETTLTKWVKSGQTPQGLTLTDQLLLESLAESGGKVKCSKLELDSDDIVNHIDAGKVVTQLGLNWRSKIQFILSADGSLKRLKFDDELKDQNDDLPREDAAARADADFVLMSAELSAMLANLYKIIA